MFAVPLSCSQVALDLDEADMLMSERQFGLMTIILKTEFSRAASFCCPFYPGLHHWPLLCGSAAGCVADGAPEAHVVRRATGIA